MRIYIYTRVCAGVRFVLLTASAFCRLEEGQRRGGGEVAVILNGQLCTGRTRLELTGR